MLIQILETLTLTSLAFASDVRIYKIKNIITMPFALLGIVTNFLIHGVTGLKISLIGWFVPVMLLFALYVLRMLGAGDIKLFGALGAIMGYRFALYTALYSFLAGGIICVVLIIVRGNALQRFKYLTVYFKACYLSRTLLEYTDFADKTSGDKFTFTYAVVLGMLIQFAVMFLGGV